MRKEWGRRGEAKRSEEKRGEVREREKEKGRWKRWDGRLHQPAAAYDGTNWPTQLTCARGTLASQLKSPYGHSQWKTKEIQRENRGESTQIQHIYHQPASTRASQLAPPNNKSHGIRFNTRSIQIINIAHIYIYIYIYMYIVLWLELVELC